MIENHRQLAATLFQMESFADTLAGLIACYQLMLKTLMRHLVDVAAEWQLA